MLKLKEILKKVFNLYIPILVIVTWLLIFIFPFLLPEEFLKWFLNSPLLIIIAMLGNVRMIYTFFMFHRSPKTHLSFFDSNRLSQYFSLKVLTYTGFGIAITSILSFFIPLNDIILDYRRYFLLNALCKFLNLAENMFSKAGGVLAGVLAQLISSLSGKSSTDAETSSTEQYTAQELQDMALESVENKDAYLARIDKWNAKFSPENTMGTFVIKNMCDTESTFGSVLRTVFPSMDIIQESGPITQEFFNMTDAFTGNEISVVKQCYEAVSNKIDFVCEGQEGNKRNSEDVLSSGRGVCREQAAILNTALNRNGIDSSIVNNKSHVWVRVKTSYGETFDLDPTNFEAFIPLISK